LVIDEEEIQNGINRSSTNKQQAYLSAGAIFTRLTNERRQKLHGRAFVCNPPSRYHSGGYSMAEGGE
jgi:hypothetical protein